MYVSHRYKTARILPVKMFLWLIMYITCTLWATKTFYRQYGGEIWPEELTKSPLLQAKFHPINVTVGHGPQSENFMKSWNIIIPQGTFLARFLQSFENSWEFVGCSMGDQAFKFVGSGFESYGSKTSGCVFSEIFSASSGGTVHRIQKFWKCKNRTDSPLRRLSMMTLLMRLDMLKLKIRSNLGLSRFWRSVARKSSAWVYFCVPNLVKLQFLAFRGDSTLCLKKGYHPTTNDNFNNSCWVPVIISTNTTEWISDWKVV